MAFVDTLEARRLLAGDGGASVLFIRGADRSGGFLEASNDSQRTEQLADLNNTSTTGGNHGWNQLKLALESAGYTVTQAIEPLEAGTPGTGQTTGAPLQLQSMNLSQYDAVVFGSNNAVYGNTQIDALENYIRGGGSALFISDANFGSNWADAPNSDQQFLDRFGLGVHQDNGTYTLTRAGGDFLVADHPIFAGVQTFDGEGVSPLYVKQPRDDVDVTLLAKAKQSVRLNTPPFGSNQQGGTRAANVGDASLLVARAGVGRIAGHFDRNTFFNANGAGTSIARFENRTFALNLFAWLTKQTPDTVPPSIQSANMDVQQGHRFQITWSENIGNTLTKSDLTVRNDGGQVVDQNAYAVQTSGTTSNITFMPRLADGNYTITIRAGAVADLTGNTNTNPIERPFFILAGDINRNRSVDFDDLLILAQNYGQTGRSFSQGNVDYSADGFVGFDDLLLLAQRYGRSLFSTPAIARRPAIRTQEIADMLY